MGLFDFLFGKKENKKITNKPDLEKYYSWRLMMMAQENTDPLWEFKNLLELGADVNYRDCSDCTPLMKAMQSVDAYPKVKLLLRYGADVHIQNYFGKTILEYALEHGPDMVQLVLNYHADVDHQDYCNMTPLMWAIRKGDIRNVDLLLTYEANVALKNNQGQTALMLAAEGIDREYLVQLLLKYNSPIDAQDKNGETALMKAILSKNKRIVRLLLDNGAKIDLQDKRGKTALSLAKEQGVEEIMTALSEYQKKQSVKKDPPIVYDSFKVTRHPSRRFDQTDRNQNMKQ